MTTAFLFFVIAAMSFILGRSYKAARYIGIVCILIGVICFGFEIFFYFVEPEEFVRDIVVKVAGEDKLMTDILVDIVCGK